MSKDNYHYSGGLGLIGWLIILGLVGLGPPIINGNNGISTWDACSRFDTNSFLRPTGNISFLKSSKSGVASTEIYLVFG